MKESLKEEDEEIFPFYSCDTITSTGQKAQPTVDEDDKEKRGQYVRRTLMKKIDGSILMVLISPDRRRWAVFLFPYKLSLYNIIQSKKKQYLYYNT